MYVDKKVNRANRWNLEHLVLTQTMRMKTFISLLKADNWGKKITDDRTVTPSFEGCALIS